jgi:hypothetical protein
MIVFRVVGVLAPYARYGLWLQWFIIALHFAFPIASIVTARFTGYHRKSVMVSFASTAAVFQFVLLVIFAVLAYIGSLSFR